MSAEKSSTACHHGHEKSEAYCLGCHDFPSLKIPFGGGAKPVPTPLPDLKSAAPVRTEAVDLVVVGSGAAGFVAAMEAHDQGVKNIVILEKMAIPGGNSQLAAGGMNAAGSVFQKAQGIEDNPKMMADDTFKGGKNIADRAMQVLGGYGYVGEYVVERLWRDAKLLEIGGGTIEAHQKNICRDLSRGGVPWA